MIFESTTYAFWATCLFCLLKNLQIFVDFLESADMDYWKTFKYLTFLCLLNTVDQIWSRCCISVSTNILLTILPGTWTIPQVYNNRISTTLNKLAMFIWNFWAFLLPFSSNHCKYFEKKKYKLPPTQLTQGQTGFLHVSFWFLLKKNLKD